MFDLDKILSDPAPLPVILPGNHGALAERYRERARHQLALARIWLEWLDLNLREHPDDDAKFDEVAEKLYPTLQELGLEVHAFRETRNVAHLS